MNVRIQLTMLSPTNCGDIRLQYSRAMVSPICGEEHEISQTPTSQWKVQPRSTGCDSVTVKSACVFCSKMSREALLNRFT